MSAPSGGVGRDYLNFSCVLVHSCVSIQACVFLTAFNLRCQRDDALGQDEFVAERLDVQGLEKAGLNASEHRRAHCGFLVEDSRYLI